MKFLLAERFFSESESVLWYLKSSASSCEQNMWYYSVFISLIYDSNLIVLRVVCDIYHLALHYIL